MTITEGITDFTYSTQVTTSGSSVSLYETCTMTGGYSASCVASYDISAHGSKTRSAETMLFTNGDEYRSHG